MELNDLVRQADLLCKQNKYSEAIELYQKAIQQNPTAQAYNNCGAAYKEIGKIQEALENARKGFLEWSNTPLHVRLKIMYKYADLLEEIGLRLVGDLARRAQHAHEPLCQHGDER